MPSPIEEMKEAVPDFARDIKLNLASVLTAEGSPGLTQAQVAGIALASAYAARQETAAKLVRSYADEHLQDAEIYAAKAAAAVMAMNNVYYRFVHLAADSEFKSMPAKLRMLVIGNPGIPKTDFELYSLAVSAINGCGACMDSHANQLVQAGVAREGVQSAVRIAAVVSAFAQVLAIVKVP